MHFKKFFDKDYLGSHDLYNESKDSYSELTVTIKEVKQQEVKNDRGTQVLPVVHFKQAIKPMILNIGNSETIANVAKTPNTNNWSGVNIILHVKSVKAFGSVVDALRIRPYAGVLELPALPDNEKMYERAAKAFAAGKFDAVTKHYKVTADQKKAIEELSKNYK